MIALPAIDLRGGACVQLVGGEYDAERVRLADPLAVAQRWAQAGFRELHVVDLDAATARGTNVAVMESIVSRCSVATQVGGGLRTNEAVDHVLRVGAARAVVGTRALEDAEWLRALAATFPNRVVVAVDVRERGVLTRGWGEALKRGLLDVLEEIDALPVAGLLVTAVHKEGQMLGTDLDLMDEVVGASRLPVYASGGITTMRDLRELERRGVTGVVIGMALYTGALDACAVAAEFAT